MNIVTFGNLSINYYFKNNILTSISGGGRAENILCNLAPNFNTRFIGYACNDELGFIAINELKELNVDTNNIRLIDGHTKINFINKKNISDICPYCNRYYKYDLCEDSKYIIDNINEDDIVIVDSIDDFHLSVINNINNKMILDLSDYTDLLNISNEVFISILDRFEVVNIHESVYRFIKEKYNYDSTDIYDLTNIKLLIISKKSKGCDIIYDDEFDERDLENSRKSINLCGECDVFFSTIIEHILNTDINLKTISKAYIDASSRVQRVINLSTAREHLIKPLVVDNYLECICNKIIIKK